MRKVLTTIALIIGFIITYFLQVNIFSSLTIGGVKPNLFIIYFLFIGLFGNQLIGTLFGIIFGIFLDSVYGSVIGVSAVMFCIIGFLGSYFDRNFSKENKITIILMIIGATFIFETGKYFLSSIILEYDREFLKFIEIVLIEILYNSLLTIILYPIIQKIGYSVDRTYKRNNILTRYF